MPYNTVEKKTEWSRRYYAENTEAVLAIKRGWVERNRDKRRAQNVVSNAIRRGKLEKQPCEVCGTTKVHAHHDDYTQPLQVRWLCPKHHKEAHCAAQENRSS